MQRTVDGHNIALPQHLLQILHTPTSNILLLLRRQRLVVKVQQLLALERFQPTQDALPDPTNRNRTHDLILEVELVLRCCRDVPVTGLDLLVSGYEVADEVENGHDDVLGDGDDVRARHLGDCDAAVCFICCVQVDVVGADARGHCQLELLGFGEALGGQIARVEAVQVSGSARLYARVSGPAHGVVTMISASTNSLSNFEFSPSLSDVVTKVCPFSSSHLRIPSSFSVVPSSSGTSRACSCPCDLFSALALLLLDSFWRRSGKTYIVEYK